MAIAAIEAGAGDGGGTATAGRRPGRSAAALLAGLALLTIGAGLGTARRLSYHEAIVAQGARELLGDRRRLVGADARRPALAGEAAAERTGWSRRRRRPPGTGSTRRRPGCRSALAAAALALVVAWIGVEAFGLDRRAARRRRPVDDRLDDRPRPAGRRRHAAGPARRRDVGELRPAPGPAIVRWRWAFFGLLGATGLAKGIGFGAALAVGAIGAVRALGPGRRAARPAARPGRPGWSRRWSALAWPLAVVARYPEAVGLWMTHVDRPGRGAPGAVRRRAARGVPGRARC